MKAAIYLRVSTRRQEKHGVSLDMQRELCRQRAEQDGYPEPVEFCEGGKSGRKRDKRPKLQELFARLGEFSAIYFYSISRLGRNKVETWQMLDQLVNAGIAIHSLKEALDLDTVSGRVVAGIQVVIAQGEAEYASERTKEGLSEVVRQGRKIGTPPFGYKPGPVYRDEDGKVLRREPMEEEPHEAEAVRYLFHEYASGTRVVTLVKWMNERFAPRRAAGWTPTTLKQILTNPAHVGMMKHGDAVLPARHKPLVDRETFDRVQARLEANRNIGPMARNRSLSPLFRCGVCGSHVQTYKGTHRIATLGCVARTMLPREQRHEPAYLKTHHAAALLWRAVEYVLSDEAITDAQRRNHQARRGGEQRRKLLEEREALAAKVVYNLEAAQAQAVPATILAAQNERHNARIAELDRMLAEEQEQAKRLEVLRHITKEEVLQTIRGADMETQRVFLKRLFDRVEIHRHFLRFVPTVAAVPPFDVEWPAAGTPADDVALRVLT